MDLKQEAEDKANALSVCELLESIKCKVDNCAHMPLIDYNVLLKRLRGVEAVIKTTEYKLSKQTTSLLAEINAVAIDPCKYYMDQKDCNNDSAIHHCFHEDNPENTEGNCRNSICPLGN